MNRAATFARTLLLAAIAVGCGGADATPPVNVAPTVTILGGAAQAVTSGTILQLAATVTDNTGRVVVSPSVVWTTSNATVATVSTSGLVTALLVGTTTVTAAAIGVSGSVTVTVTPGLAARMTILSQPSGAAAGAALTAQPRLELRDAAGNLAAATSVVASLISGGGTLSGATVTTAAGIATFTALAVSGIVGPRVLTFTATTGTAPATNSEFFVLQPGAAAAVGLRRPPSGGGLNNAFSTQPVAEIRDGSGNVVTASAAVVTADVTAGGGALSGASATAVQGVATFSGLTITGTPGPRTLSFGSGILAPAPVAVVPCDVSQPPSLALQPAYTRTTFVNTVGVSDSLPITDRNGSCVAPAGLAASLTFPGVNGWLTASVVAIPGRPLLTLRTVPGTLASGTYQATVNVTSTNAGAVAMPVALTLRPTWSLSIGSATQKVNILDPLATLLLPVTVRDTTGTVVSAPVAFVHRSPSIATVAASGLITARAGGFGWIVGKVTGNGDPVDSVLVAVTGGAGPLLRIDLQRLTYDIGDNFSVLVQLDTRGASIGAAEVIFSWPSVSDGQMMRLNSVVPGGVGSPTVTNTTATGTTRIVIASGTPMTGVITLGRFDYTALVSGNGQFITRFVDLVAPDQTSLLSGAWALNFPVVVR